MRSIPFATFLIALAACAAPASGPRAVQPAGATPPIGPYSLGIARGEFVFVSGQIGSDPISGEPLEGIDAQTARAIERVRAVLAAEGLDLQHVVSVTAYLVDMQDFAAFNTAYAREFREPFPARATVGVAALPKGARVEIQCTAMRP